MRINFRMVIAVVVVILAVSSISASAGYFIKTSANLPWRGQYFMDHEDGVKNLSTAFVGTYQIPMLSYSKVGSNNIFQAHMATSAVPGNCGPNNAWYCTSWHDNALIPGTVSNMATLQIMDTHLIKWAYSASGGTIRGATIELMNDMTPVTDDWQELIKISKFGSTVIGTPSLQIVGGHFVMAATILASGDLYPYQLVYMHYIGNFNNDSCIDGGFAYQCDVIDFSYGAGSMGAPSLSISENGAVGIAYYKAGADNGVMYAYPHVSQIGWPSNCGPGGDTWRCISIYHGTPTGVLGNVVKLASGQSLSESGIVFTYDDELIPVTLFHADFVGAGGNCGFDFGPGGLATHRWQCDDIIYNYYLGPTETPSFSIDIDPEGYSVIAYDYREDDLANNNLYVAYPKARVGNPDAGWITQYIDGGSYWDIETGAQLASSLDNAGRGFISYLQEDFNEYPAINYIKIAYQLYQTHLPLLIK